MEKKRAIVSYENMSEELAAAFNEKYPKGLADYLPDVKKIDKPDGTSIFTVTVEIPTAIYLVKLKMKIDDTEDIDRWLEGDDSDGGDDEDDAEALPDDNISQYSNGEDDPSDSD